jgi:hypothetical protein
MENRRVYSARGDPPATTGTVRNTTKNPWGQSRAVRNVRPSMKRVVPVVWSCSCSSVQVMEHKNLIMIDQGIVHETTLLQVSLEVLAQY